jgi:hypothetical protein
MVYTSIALNWVPAPEGWTGISWLFSGPLGAQGTRNAGALVFTALTAAFVVLAAGLVFKQIWASSWLFWVPIASSLALFVFWDGSPQDLLTKGFIGILINIGLLVALVIFRYPAI